MITSRSSSEILASGELDSLARFSNGDVSSELLDVLRLNFLFGVTYKDEYSIERQKDRK